MKISDLDQALYGELLTEAPMGLISKGMNKLGSKFGSNKATGKLNAGNLANQLKKEYEYQLGLHGDSKDEHSLEDFFKSKGLDTSILPNLVSQYNTTPAQQQAPTARSSAMNVGALSRTNASNTNAAAQAASNAKQNQNLQNVFRRNPSTSQTQTPSASDQQTSPNVNPTQDNNQNNASTATSNTNDTEIQAPAVSTHNEPKYNSSYKPPFGYSSNSDTNNNVIDLDQTQYTTEPNAVKTNTLPNNKKQTTRLPKPETNPADNVIQLGQDRENKVIQLGQDKPKKQSKQTVKPDVEKEVKGKKDVPVRATTPKKQVVKDPADIRKAADEAEQQYKDPEVVGGPGALDTPERENERQQRQQYHPGGKNKCVSRFESEYPAYRKRRRHEPVQVLAEKHRIEGGYDARKDDH